MVVESVEPSCWLTKFLSRYKSTKKRQKQTKHAVSLLTEDERVTSKQLSINLPFRSTKCRKKELCVYNRVQETIGDVYCQTCRNEKCVYISTNKRNSFYDCKKCQDC